MEPRIGVEPMTDNPMSSAHQLSAGKRSTVELPGVLTLHYRRMRDGAELNRHCRIHENPQSTARYKDRRIRDELGVYVLYH